MQVIGLLEDALAYITLIGLGIWSDLWALNVPGIYLQDQASTPCLGMKLKILQLVKSFLSVPTHTPTAKHTPH